MTSIAGVPIVVDLCLRPGLIVLVPPPDTYEFYRRHGRWPKPGEA